MTRQYPDKILQAALEKGISEGLLQPPIGELELSKVLTSLDVMLRRANEVIHELAEQKERERLMPVKIASVDGIPWAGDDLLFIDVADEPGRDICTRIFRCEYEFQALCIIGASPEWISEVIMTGHRVYELPAGSPIQIGQRALKPHPSSMGVRWCEVRVGEYSIQFN